MFQLKCAHVRSFWGLHKILSIFPHTLSLLSPLSRDLLKIVSSKLGPFVGQGAAYAEPKGSDKEILDLLSFFQESSSQVTHFRILEVILLVN
jgi:hypothetical protein